MAKKRRIFASGDGCGYVVVTCIVSCCFLVMNGALFAAVYTYAMHAGPAWLEQSRVEQTMKLVVPVLMLVIEWRLVDLLADLVTRKAGRKDRAP